jgi:catalase (peroxidase I)
MTSNELQQPISVRESSWHDIKSIINVLSISSIAFGVSQSSNAALTADEMALQYNQRPDPNSAVITQNGVRPDFASVRNDIEDLIKARSARGPTLVRLAWHSSGTYDKISKTGGSEKGTIRFKEELAHGANGGLDLAISWLEPIYKKYNKNADLSYADLYTLAGVVAIKTLGNIIINIIHLY